MCEEFEHKEKRYGRRREQARLEADGPSSQGVRGGHYSEYPSLAPDKLLEGDLEFNLDFRSLYTEILEDWMEVDARPVVKSEYERVGFLKN